MLQLPASLLISEWYESPFIIPVAGCAMIGSIAVAGIWSGVRNREIRSQERLAMIAQGLQPEPDWEDNAARAATEQNGPKTKIFGRQTDGAGARRAGLILVSIGVGLIVFFAFLAIVLRERDVFSGAAAGILPLAIGAGFLVDARLRRQEWERALEQGRLSSVELGAALPEPAPRVPPPPPPAPVSAAQASDWRPLH
jgi:hypothetical protein